MSDLAEASTAWKSTFVADADGAGDGGVRDLRA